ncbi:hypothetical protein ACWDR0_27790 [Streptomyces sp. NPDC003691]
MVKAQGTRTGRLLLFLALLFGVVTMHTVGHPSSGHTTGGARAHTTGHPAGAAAPAPAPAPAPVEKTGGTARAAYVPSIPDIRSAPGILHPLNAPAAAHAGSGAPATESRASLESPGAPHAPAAQPTAAAGVTVTAAAAGAAVLRDGGPAPGVMDPTMVCLAVLGAFGVALLVFAGAWLRQRAAAAAAAVGLTSGGVRAAPRPPPPRIRLAQLSVLRI